MNQPPPVVQAELLPHGALLRLQAHGVMLNMFPANRAEGGPANLWLRLHTAGQILAAPLLGPQSPLTPLELQPGVAWAAAGTWQGLRLLLQLRLATAQAAWFWHLQVDNTIAAGQRVDLIAAQDIGLAPLATIRLNEYYVSHYLDLTPLQHARHGPMVAARQNQPVAGRHPWLLMGSLHRAVAFATDALQLLGVAVRCGRPAPALQQGLPGRRLQHEHALAALQDEAVDVPAGGSTTLGVFGTALADHPQATSDADLRHADAALALPEAQPLVLSGAAPLPAVATSLFAGAPALHAVDLTADDIDSLFGSQRRHEEFDAAGRLLSFFHTDATHVVLAAKEAAVMRPHGHLLRSGEHAVPDETALTSTVWMAGVFHSMVTQGHVGINRFLSTVRGALGQFVSQGLRAFVDGGDGWQLLGVPSAFEMRPDGCRWFYRHAGGLLVVSSGVQHRPHQLTLQLRVLSGPPLKLLITQHVVLGGDDGVAPAPPLQLCADGDGVFIGVPPGSELAQRFSVGGARPGFFVAPDVDSRFERWGDDAVLWSDGVSQGQSFVCIEARAAPRFGLRIEGRLLDAAVPAALVLRVPPWTAPLLGPLSAAAQRLADIAPWYLHNALVHYLAPRGLEQFSGGGWGTRDACQGPVEMLLALDQPGAVRDLLLRVFAAQQADGDWPQWFMFFEREKHIRAGDSHGDIVFWPLVALARYLAASGDTALLDVALPFHDAPQAHSVWQHVQAALALIATRRIAGTELAAYGHGDWNDSLQPADPALREHLCSSWTVTLHHQALHGLAQALEDAGQAARAVPLRSQAVTVRADFQRRLVADDVVAGYALFDPAGSGSGAPAAELLLHPRDRRTGLHYSLLPMMHAVLENMLSPAQADLQATLIDRYLTGPDGARLFDRALAYRGGPMQMFQRAESSAFFGREIGVMYMHAHLRWAEMLAHLGRAQAFFDALQRAHPIALHSVVPQATARQANCYYSSSDAAFADRYEAVSDYDKLLRGEVPLDGGWRVYSSGPGIVIGLIVGRLLGVRREHHAVHIDPVLPAALAGLVARLPLLGHELELELQPGPLGHGPLKLVLDGVELPFTRGDNPYRVGAAVVAVADLRAALQAGTPGTGRRLAVYTG